MVGTCGSTPVFLGLAFEAVVQRAVDALRPGLTTRLANEIRQNGTRGNRNDNQLAAKGRVFSSTKNQAANSLEHKIRSANLFPLDMNAFDIKLWAWVG
nr:hypothetical protein [Tanacetum cinerariifolium]